VSYNSNTLIIWHFRRAVPRLEVLLFTRRIFTSETGRSLGYVKKGLQDCLYINQCNISSLFISNSIYLFVCEDFIKHRRGP
jgi:hypothetical protein